MNLRVTPLMSTSQAIRTAQLHNAQLADLQTQASTGLRIQRPSDDPQAIRNLLARKLDDSRFDVQLANINDARSTLNDSVSTLLEVNRFLVRARDIALEGNQSQTPEILAEEVGLLIERLVDLANPETNGTYLFSGTSTDQKPFELATASGGTNTTSVTYQGSPENSSVVVASDVTVETLLTGTEVFQPQDRADTILIGETGAAGGSGTGTGVGSASLTVRHTATSYGGGSGVQPGTNSLAGDNIIGPAGTHTLTVTDTSGTGAEGTVSLDGGEAVTFTSGDANLQVTGPSGEVVYVDTANVTPGFSGTVSITADGTLSSDGGLTEIAIDYSANQAVIDSNTGAVTYIDSSQISRAGVEQIEYTGKADVFHVLSELRDDLRNERNLSPQELTEAFARRIADIDRIHHHILSVVGQQSLTLEDLYVVERRLQDQQLATREAISDLESADISEVAIRLQGEQNLLQFTFATTAGLFDQSLLDFLR